VKPRRPLFNVEIDVLEVEGLDQRSARAIAARLREALEVTIARDTDQERFADGKRSLTPGKELARDASSVRAIADTAAQAIREGLRQ